MDTTQQFYEEISDVSVSKNTVSTAAIKYENVNPATTVQGVAEPGGNYDFTLCSAYGVPL